MAPIEADEDELTEVEDDDGPVHRGSNVPLGTDEYINRVTGRKSDEDSDSDIEITDVRRKLDKGKRKAEEKDEWSDEEGETVYEKFKNRRAAKRKKVAATKKKIKEKTKQAVASHKSAKTNGESSKEKKEGMWGDQEDYSDMLDDVPEYIQKRRKQFDKDYEILHEAGLKIPPRYEDVEDVEFSDDERLVELEERPNFPPSVEVSRGYKDIELPSSAGIIPASIAQYLRDYQLDGVKFLHELFVYQKGGILGDDMGLGKTIQVVAFLTAAFGKTGDERDAKRMRKMRRSTDEPWYPRVLIVCPGSVMQNWKNELDRWGWWWAEIYHDPKTRVATLAQAKSGRLEVLITTYHSYKNHKEKLNMVPWDCVVADECHTLKGKSDTTQAMNEVNALCRIGLTGTAIQNKYEELWFLLNWTNPGHFGPLSTWVSSICEPLRTGQSHDATYHQLKRARQTAKKLVHNLLPEFFLRRLKSLIAHQLPKKTDRVVFCPLTEVQRDAYENFLNSDTVGLVRTATEDCDCNSGKKRGWCCYKTLPDSNTSWKAMVFPLITILQKLSNHLALLIPNSSDPSEKQTRDLDFLQQMLPNTWEELYNNRASLANLTNQEFCGKWKVLKKLLKFWHENGDKVLIFSHSVKLLKLLEHLFENTSYNASFLSGSMPHEERQITVDAFNSDPIQFVFLISTKAGGVGLNITSANKVVIFDPNWNPSYDLQAQDRAYRIGQHRDVEVYRLVSAGTLEEIVYARQIYKQQQANIGYSASTERRYFKGVQNAPGQKGEIFGLDNLFTFRSDDIVLRDIVNKTNVAEAKRGIDVLDVDMDDMANDDDNPLKADNDEKGDAAMSQLAALLTEGDGAKSKKKAKSKPKTDAVSAILAAAGVEYTHENSEVIGSSKVEAELSRRAEEAGNDVDFGEQRLFAESQTGADLGGGKVKYEFHPPEDVMERQFCTMAKMFGFSSATEFAFVVEGWTQKQRTDCLERFYTKRREKVAVANGYVDMSERVYDGAAGTVDADDEPDTAVDSVMKELDGLLGSSDGEDAMDATVDKTMDAIDHKPAVEPPIAPEDIETEDEDDEL
ncbi:probable DNA repair and recombination protein RAD26 [Phialocephala subalpina]|uniref:Probable DNA repair and recombination protein RAD26 n=1 Tax=Phialocephala subalpina TaxID=576137 RepID=A0A1L7X496_9HELO|nr:probable DNA repair and recombination protein RAD26 [Phialocephala subalpina]